MILDPKNDFKLLISQKNNNEKLSKQKLKFYLIVKMLIKVKLEYF